jgi:transcriptional regulator NrdR family protein
MKCPECGVWAAVKETRQRANGSTYRRYVCANGHLFSTKELVVAGRSKNPVGVLSAAIDSPRSKSLAL